VQDGTWSDKTGKQLKIEIDSLFESDLWSDSMDDIEL
jgi:hypothetical protein